ncbi:MAG: hypothetical protein AAGA20_04625 [Planctomycetota bacterium]
MNSPGSSTTTSDPNVNVLAPELKKVQIGALGVRAAEMLAHPRLDLRDDDDNNDDDAWVAEPGPGDADDVVFIASGRLGLWAIEAHPAPSYENRAVRIDASGNLNVATQNSERYCNGLDFARIGDTTYLVALHSKAGHNRVRFYDLDRIAAVFANADAAGLGGEIAPDRQVFVKEHPSAPASPTTAVAYALDIDVHQCTQTFADVYVAVGTHGLARIQARPGPSGTIVTSLSWGPIFGTGSPGAHTPAARYADFEWWSMERSQRFESVTRSDAPVFVDVATHASGEGCKVYAAVDHLGWVRFDVTDPLAWSPSMPIDVHEAVDVSLQTTPGLSNDVWFQRNGAQLTPIQQTTWDPPLVRMFDLLDGSQVGRDGGGINFCHEVDIIQVEVDDGSGGTTFEPVLAAQYRIQPWHFNGRVPRLGGFSYDTYQKQANSIDSLALSNLRAGSEPAKSLRGRCAFHKISAIDAGTPGPFTWDGFVPDGGSDTHFPEFHRATNTGELGAIHFVHGRTTVDEEQLEQDLGIEIPIGGCLSYFRLDDGTPGAIPGLGLVRNAPVHVRNVADRVGRHHFYVGPSVIDPELMITSFSDSNRVDVDGMLYSPYDTATGRWTLDRLDAIVDERGTAGVVTERLSQWIRGGNLWTWGGASENVVHWELKEHLYTAGTGGSPPTCLLGRQWSLKVPDDRWEHFERDRRPEHVGGAVSDGFDAYTVQRHATLGLPQDRATTFVLATTAGTPDGLQLIGRDLMMTDVDGAITPGIVPFEDPRDAPGQQPLWDTVQFETHPEWRNFPALRYHDSNDDPFVTGMNQILDNSLWEEAAAWWRPGGSGPFTSGPGAPDLPVAPIQLSAGACRTYPPRIFELRSSATVEDPDTWVALVPCSHAVCPETVVDSSGTATPPPGVIPLHTPAIDPSFAPDPFWGSNHGRGFLQVFKLDDPWQLVDSSRIIVSDPNGAQTFDIIRPHRSTLDPLLLSRAESAAFRAQVREFEVAGETLTYAFVADFSGAVDVFDLTDALYRPSTGSMTPIWSWTAPLSVFDTIANNTRAIEVDVISDDVALVYVGVSRIGIVSIPFEVGSGFLDAQRHVVPTPGEVWGLEIREWPSDPSRRTLMCADAYGGNRVYSLGTIEAQASGASGL